MSKYADFDYIKAARRQFSDDNIYDFDDKPQVSPGDDPGAYVQVWVWIADDDIAASRPIRSDPMFNRPINGG